MLIESRFHEGVRLLLYLRIDAVCTHMLLASSPEQLGRIQLPASRGQKAELDAQRLRELFRLPSRVAAGLVEDQEMSRRRYCARMCRKNIWKSWARFRIRVSRSRLPVLGFNTPKMVRRALLPVIATRAC